MKSTSMLAVSVLVALLHSTGSAVEPVSAERFPDDARNLSRVGEARLISDLSTAQPAAALKAGPREKGKWRVISYATADFEGRGLSTFRDSGTADVQIPLKASGRHAVYIGLCTCSAGLDSADENGIRVKLSGEAVYRRMSNGLPLLKPRRDQIQEIFLTAADLTGQSLDVAAMPFKPATLCYVKLVPLSDEELASKPKDVNRNTIATFDGHSWIWPYKPRTVEHLRETFREMGPNAFGQWWVQVLGADLTCYDSKVGTIPGIANQDFHRWEHGEFADSMKTLVAAGINPLKMAREEAARQHAEFHVMIRPSAWIASYPFEETFDSRFALAHPEWRCVDRDGTPTLHMSYAYPEVQKQVFDVIRETLELQPDGVGFLFHRGMPMILWEEPFCRAFQAIYGADALTVAEDDPRILDLRAAMMTDFLREVRYVLNSTAEKQGRKTPYQISLSTFSKESDNRKFGLDVSRWAREGIVDQLAVAYFAHHTSFVQPDMAYYRRVVEGTKVGLYPFVIAWHTGTPKQLCERVTKFYADGATGIAVWDPSIEAHYRDKSPGNVFDIASRVGDKDLIARWAKTPPQPPSIPLTRFEDNHYSRWFPNTGY